MNNAATITILFVIVAFFIAVLGVTYGDQITADLPGGKATGVVAGVLLLIVALNRLYKSISKMEYNKLDEPGFNRLMEKHLKATSYSMMGIFMNGLEELEEIREENPERKATLIKNIEGGAMSMIDKSRFQLSLFRTDKIDNIPTFLGETLSKNELGEHIKKGLEIIQSVDKKDDKRKKIKGLIEQTQNEFLRKLSSS
jgi:hypothetical protein